MRIGDECGLTQGNFLQGLQFGFFGCRQHVVPGFFDQTFHALPLQQVLQSLHALNKFGIIIRRCRPVDQIADNCRVFVLPILLE